MRGFVGALFVIILGGLLTFVFTQRQPRFPSDIVEFLPVGDDSSSAAKELARSGLSQRVVLLIEGVPHEQRREFVGKFVEDMKGSGLFREVSGGPPNTMSQVHDVYFPHRYSHLASTSEELEQLNTAAAMQDKAESFLAALNGRYSMFLQRAGPKDPLLAYIGMVERLSTLMRPTMHVVDGFYQTSSGESVIFAELSVSPFDSKSAVQVHDFIHTSFDQHNVFEAKLMISGVYRYTKSISTTIKNDIQRITVVSLFGILFIFGFGFGKLRFALLPILSIGVGVLAAILFTSIVLSEIHLIALAFGASLIGVCVDFSIHFLNLSTHSKRSVWPPIWLGALTTIGGFSVLLTSTVPALKQIAVFSTIGVVTSVGTTWLLARHFFLTEKAPRHQRAVVAVNQMFDLLRTRPLWALSLGVPTLLIPMLGLPSLHIEKDMRSLRDPLPALRIEDELVQAKISGERSSSVIIVRGNDAQTALDRNDSLAVQLEHAIANRELEGYSSMHHLLWSGKTQAMNREFLQENRNSLLSKMSKAYDEAGVDSATLEPIKEQNFFAPKEFLTLSDLRGSALSSLVDLFDARKDGTVLLTFLERVDKPQALADRVAAVPGAFMFNQEDSLNSAWQELGHEITRAALYGLALIAFIVVLGFRKVRSILVAMVPPFAGCFASLGVFGLMEVPVGPIHGLGLMLVIALAADYGVMLASHHRDIGPAALSIFMAYGSTMFSFGALGLSEHPLLRSFGLTIAMGATFALLLLPFSAVLLQRKKDTVCES
ncbi:hypothetical protein FRD01_14325 [Microvenator marinus]|uniref:Membrane transport protein MMPL domain-containing protein n=1 Tax=Microvenator marinus TaxID=2600177 RepID=A0A5B8XTF3_9DELT|nr:hypothetical protein [Microvenator marinus]QED28387.1 hypothetical protein FRD01_14325 [Microvenator marinus]